MSDNDVTLEIAELSRWKSVSTLRIEALEGLLANARVEAAKGKEAISSLASERAANAILTNEVDELREENKRLLASLEAVNGHTGAYV